MAKIIASIGRTCFWNNLVVRPHPEQAGRYQLAYGHNRIAACRKAGIKEAELEVIELSDYDMLCCMIDENLTQQHIAPKTIFEIVAASVQEAEKMLRESKNVYDFNAQFRHSKGLPSLLQKSHGIDQYHVIAWRDNEYQKAKEAISPGGDGLGRRAIMQFLPANSIANPNTLHTALTAYYQERWKQEWKELMEESGRQRDAGRLDESLELEKQARVLLGKFKVGGISRALLCSLSNNEKASDPEAAGKRGRV